MKKCNARQDEMTLTKRTANLKLTLSSMLVLLFINVACTNVSLDKRSSAAASVSVPPDTKACLPQLANQTFLPGIILWHESQGFKFIYTKSEIRFPNGSGIGINELPHDWYIDGVQVAEATGRLKIPVSELVNCKLYKLKAIFLFCGANANTAIEQDAYLGPCP